MKNNNLSHDFSYNNLPLHRRGQFLDIIKNEWKTLLLLGLWFLIAAIPYIVIYALKFYGYSFLLGAYQEAGISEEEIYNNLLIYNLIADSVNVISYIPFAIVFAGASRIYRNLIYDEGILFKEDFIKGIKTMFKYYIVIMLIYGVIKIGVNFTVNMSNLTGDIFTLILSGFLLIAFYVVIVPSLSFICNLQQIYKISIFNSIRSSVKMTFSSIFIAFLFVLPLYFVQYISIIAVLLFEILILIMIVLLIIPVYLLGWKLFVAYLFDKFINLDNYPDFYRKGLAPYANSIKNKE